MTGYELYRFCRSLRGWTSPEFETYLNSQSKGHYEKLSEYFIKTLRLDIKDIKQFIQLYYNKNPNTFNPHELFDECHVENYEKWKSTSSTKEQYYESIRKSFIFIENFCINNNTIFENYKKKYALKHVRENKIEYAVSIYLNLIDIKNLKSVEKIVLKKYLSQYNITMKRMSSSEMKEIMQLSYENLKNTLTEFSLM